jgi:RNA polymerase sigma-70 factor (ECF subfamily)
MGRMIADPHGHDQYRAIYEQHRQGLFTLALAITGCAAVAEDAVQEAFVRLWQAPPVSGDRVAYVHRAVRNAALDQRRRRAVRRGDDAGLAFLAAPADDVDREAQHDLRQALGLLPDEQREAIVLHLYAGLTFAQAADVVGEPQATIASRYRRALERLRTRLAVGTE